MSGEYAGPTLHELLWEKMEEATDKVMSGGATDKEIGRALGISEALALFTNPYSPKPKAIREEAKRRWRGKQDSK